MESEETSRGEDWRVQDLSGADWALEKLGELRRQVAENEKLAQEKMDWLKARLTKLNEPLLKGIAYFESRLAAFAQEKRAELVTGKSKSRKLLHGTIAWRLTGGALKVQDKDALLAWAREQPVEQGFVRIEEKPAVDEIKKHIAATGEVVPGCELEPKREEIQFKTEVDNASAE